MTRCSRSSARHSPLQDDISNAIEAAAATEAPVRSVLLDAESIHDIDSTGAQMSMELLDELEERDIGFALARVRTELRDELAAAGLEDRIGRERIYLEVDDGVSAFRA